MGHESNNLIKKLKYNTMNRVHIYKRSTNRILKITKLNPHSKNLNDLVKAVWDWTGHQTVSTECESGISQSTRREKSEQQTQKGGSSPSSNESNTFCRLQKQMGQTRKDKKETPIN
jgi:hypothetical protein